MLFAEGVQAAPAGHWPWQLLPDMINRREDLRGMQL